MVCTLTEAALLASDVALVYTLYSMMSEPALKGASHEMIIWVPERATSPSGLHDENSQDATTSVGASGGTARVCSVIATLSVAQPPSRLYLGSVVVHRLPVLLLPLERRLAALYDETVNR
eukprot:scaffold3265_cov63-Phaeocystis_antarctica.AAC.2